MNELRLIAHEGKHGIIYWQAANRQQVNAALRARCSTRSTNKAAMKTTRAWKRPERVSIPLSIGFSRPAKTASTRSGK